MKALLIAVSLVVSATAGVAGAAEGAPATAPQVMKSNTTQVTRAQVRAELVQAEKSGQLAYLESTLYKGGS